MIQDEASIANRGKGFPRALIAIFALFAISGSAFAQTFLNVSTAGRDTWSGSLAQPNAGQTDGPLATVQAAVNKIRALRSQGRLSARGAVVSVYAGRYELSQTIDLTQADSGTPSAPIRYRAIGPVLLDGGKQVNGWTAVSDPAALARIKPSVAASVLRTSLPSQGVAEYGTLSRRGTFLNGPSALELVYNDQAQQLARYPNANFLTLSGVFGPTIDKFQTSDLRPSSWANLNDVWAHGYWGVNFAESFEKITAWDAASGTVTLQSPASLYPYRLGQPFYYVNVLEELDAPGEYYLDRTNGELYFYAPAPLSAGQTTVTMLSTPLLRLTNTKSVSFAGFTFQNGRGNGVEITNGQSDVLAGCVIRNFGRQGANVGGKTNLVTSNDIYLTGEYGLCLFGGDRTTLTPGNNLAENNYVHDYARLCRMSNPGLEVAGVGNTLRGNRISYGPQSAIMLFGNNHLVEKNDIYKVCLEGGDSGAFYMGQDMTQQGSIVRFNMFRDNATSFTGTGDPNLTVAGVYLDDFTSGMTVTNNIFVRCGRGVLIGGGRDNTVDNNLFFGCDQNITADARGLTWATASMVPGGPLQIIEKVQAMKVWQAPFSVQYPHLANILNDQIAIPKRNSITRCVSNGVLADIALEAVPYIHLSSSYTGPNPGFTSPTTLNFQLLPGTPGLVNTGFANFSSSQIGLFVNQYRSLVPLRDGMGGGP